jgi:murein DD-endopeptidase MepM/ murein hydrolase activator NlpD
MDRPGISWLCLMLPVVSVDLRAHFIDTIRLCWKLDPVLNHLAALTLLMVTLSLTMSPSAAALGDSAARAATQRVAGRALVKRVKGAKRERAKRARRSTSGRAAAKVGIGSATTRRLNPEVRAGQGRREVLAPYSLRRVFRGFGKCRKGKHTHQAIDIGGVGENSGLGTPIFAMGRSKVTLIGLPREDPRQFGAPDVGRGTVRRGYKGNLVLPKQQRVPGYGKVNYFTKDYGSWRSGVVVSTKVLEGPLAGHEVRYMHLGAVHPTLKRGTVVEAGEELGLMGGTAIMDSAPHVHIDITDPEGARVDVARLLGLPQAAQPCPTVKSGGKRPSARPRAD